MSLKKRNYNYKSRLGLNKGIKRPYNLGDNNPARRPEVRKKLREAALGRKHTEESKRKMSEAQKGKKKPPRSEETRKNMSESHKGQIPWSKGKTNFHSEEGKRNLGEKTKELWNNLEYRKHMSDIHKNKKLSKETKIKISLALMGVNAPNWRCGISFEPYGIEFNRKLKEQIRKRDNYRCQQCFRHQDELYSKRGKKYKLHIHHIDFNKKNNLHKNLISLCRNCHSQTNYNRGDWTNYFKEKISVYNI